MKTSAILRSLYLPGLAALLAAAVPAAAQTVDPQFSYQGRLNDAHGPATGLFDMRFDLYTAETGGAQIGTSLLRNAVGVTGGFFSTELDFGGGGAFDGSARWLEVYVRPSGTAAPYTRLDPRQRIAPVPYALRALSAGSVATGSITDASISPGGLTGAVLMNGSIGGQHLNLTGAPPSAGQLLSWDGGSGAFTWTNPPAPPPPAWLLGGNTGTTPASDFIGTLDNAPLQFRAGGYRTLELTRSSRSFGFPFITGGVDTSNILAGFSSNSIAAGVIGATIAGGGSESWDIFGPGAYEPNTTQSDFSTVSGGNHNTILNESTGAVISGGSNNTINTGATGSVIPGGENNTVFFGASGALAAGTNALAGFSGSFVWSDRQSGQFAATDANQFAVRAENGLYLSSNKGIRLNAADSPIVTRGWDAFDGTAGNKAGHGRWGLFMEPFNLVCGIPEVSGRGFEVAKYRTDGTRTSLFTVGQSGAVWSNSSASFTTVTIRGGADLAEPFDTGDEVIAPGSVVVIDGDGTGRLARSSKACDTRVAGVVSGANGINPGLCLSQEGVNEDGTKVALTGRVYCLCDAAGAAIVPGDLLTTADTPGHAMKAPRGEKARGAILGKAMSSLAKGERGHVLILVTLQ